MPLTAILNGGCVVKQTAVSDTGPPLHLVEIGKENLLSLFRAVIISEEVQTELVRHGVWDKIQSVPLCMDVVQVNRNELIEQRRAMSGFRVHLTDISVAALAARMSPDVVLTDDLELRKGLENQGRLVVGSVGILIRSFKTGNLGKSELLACIDTLLNGSSLYLSKGFAVHIRRLLEDM